MLLGVYSGRLKSIATVNYIYERILRFILKIVCSMREQQHDILVGGATFKPLSLFHCFSRSPPLPRQMSHSRMHCTQLIEGFVVFTSLQFCLHLTRFIDIRNNKFNFSIRAI